MSAVIRIPDEVYVTARRLAALQGRQPGDLIAEAWELYLDTNRDDLVASIDTAAADLRAEVAPPKPRQARRVKARRRPRAQSR